MFKKIIIIKDNNLDDFYKKLFLYRSIIYRFTIFECDNEKISKIIHALNIKNRYKRIEYIFDEGCKEIDDFFNGENICGFNCGICYRNLKNGCCRKCLYVGDKGCTSSNLTCKFFFCTDVKERYKIVKLEDIKILQCLSLRQRSIVRHNFYTIRENAIMDLYYGSVSLFIIRYLYRSFKNIFIKREIKLYN